MPPKNKSEEIIDGEIVHIDPETLPEKLNLGNLALQGPKELIERATQMATHLKLIVEQQHLFTEIRGKKHVHVEGWTTLLSMIGVTPREEGATRYDDGSWEVMVGLYNYHDVCVGKAAAICGVDEKDRNGDLTWANRPEYARRSMAATRATGKAARLSFSWIMTMAGYSPTPWEEIADQPGFTNEGTPAKKNGNGAPKPPTGERSPDMVTQYGQALFDYLKEGGTFKSDEFWNFSKIAEFDNDFSNELRMKFTEGKNTQWVQATVALMQEWNKNAERMDVPQINLSAKE